MTQVYTLESAGDVPVTLANAKAHLKHSSTADDAYTTTLLSTLTAWGESYTGVSFRAQGWKLLDEYFVSRILLDKAKVNVISSVKHLVDGELAVVADSVYRLKLGTYSAEILLQFGQEWPSTTDDVEQALEIEFTTAAFPETVLIQQAIFMHLAYVYVNRGDNDTSVGLVRSAKLSGAMDLYNSFALPRI